MAFCSSCGTEVKGAFCSSCGAPVSGSTLPQAAPQQTVVPGGIVMPQAADRRKTSVAVWILCGVGALIVLGLIGSAMVAYWFVSNPGMALGKVLTAANPEIEVRDVDNARQRITIRDRRDGKEVTLSFDDVKNGR